MKEILEEELSTLEQVLKEVFPEDADEFIDRIKKENALDLSHTAITDENICKILAALQDSNLVKNLGIQGEFITLESSNLIEELLKRNTSLTELYISDYKIPDELEESKDVINKKLITSLATGLSKNQTLKTLKLEVTQISFQGLKMLGQALSINTGLTTLDLYDNPTYKDMDDDSEENSLQILDFLKNNKSLKSLNLCANYIKDVNLKLIAEALKQNTTLTELNLSQNSIGNSSAVCISDLFKNNTTIKKLNISDTNISLLGIHTILQSNNGLVCLNINYNITTSDDIIKPSPNLIYLNDEKTCNYEIVTTALDAIITSMQIPNSILTEELYSKFVNSKFAIEYILNETDSPYKDITNYKEIETYFEKFIKPKETQDDFMDYFTKMFFEDTQKTEPQSNNNVVTTILEWEKFKGNIIKAIYSNDLISLDKCLEEAKKFKDYQTKLSDIRSTLNKENISDDTMKKLNEAIGKTQESFLKF